MVVDVVLGSSFDMGLERERERERWVEIGGSGCEVVVDQVVGGGGLLVGLQWLDVSIGD